MSEVASRFIVATLFLAIFIYVAVPSAAARETTPGKERWPIKTSLPTGSVAKKAIPLSDLLNLPDPPNVRRNDALYQSNRIPSFPNALAVKEGDLITTTGWLHLVASETDGDYHIQVSESRNSGDHCLVVEVPLGDPEFVSSESLRRQVEQVRAFIREKLLVGKEPSAAGSVMNHPVSVRITGQLFYDDAHVGDHPRGKKGMHAATLWELHPVTVIEFAPSSGM